MSPERSQDSARLFAQAAEHHQAGRLDAAAHGYRAILAEQPLHHDSLFHLGLIALQRRDFAAAVQWIGRALVLLPQHADRQFTLAVALKEQGRPDDAAAVLRAAVCLRPDDAKPYYHLADALEKLGRGHEAMEACRRAVLIAPPSSPFVWNNLAIALLDHHRPEESLEACRQAIRLKGDNAEAHSNLGNAYYRLGRFAEAAAAVRQALALRPDFAGAHNNLGIASQASGQLSEAIAAYQRALRCKPDHAPSHYNLATGLLLAGDYAAGWREYEWRWQGGVKGPVPRVLSQPAWQGDDPAGKTILVHAEQGLGDTLQFARYVPLLASRGARVVLECQAPLKRLLTTLPGVARVVATGEALPPFDCHLQLMSAPFRFATTLATIPAGIPYLRADPQKTAAWGKRLGRLSGLRVGLVWAGNPRTHDAAACAVDRRRSLELRRLERLLAVPGVSFVSLQAGAPAQQIPHLPAELRPLDLMGDVDDFADTAALTVNLDLVITVDTAIAHLAGAMGKPVWIASRFDGCWRWLEDREDSPWYPTARLFRQPAPGDWDSVVDRLASELERVARIRRGAAETVRKKISSAGLRAGDRRDAAKTGTEAGPTDSPAAPDLLFRHAAALQNEGRPAEAEQAYRALLALRPDHATGLNNLGNTLRDQGRCDEAAQAFRQALTLVPDYAEAHYNLGLLMHRQDLLTEAVAAYGRATAIRPDFPQAWTNLGTALQDQERLIDAEAVHRTAAACWPQDRRILLNLGVTLNQAGHTDEALALFRRAVDLDPGYAQGHVNLAHCLLLKGEYEEGWREYEWRWKGGVDGLVPRGFVAPQWDGGDVDGRTILLHAEQGLGDTLHFARYATSLAKRGGRVILEVQPPLKRLLATVPGVSQVVATGEALPPFDLHLPLMSAPYALGTRLDNIPTVIPYVRPDAAAQETWRQRLAGQSGVKIGLVWAGESRTHDHRLVAADRRRSLPLATLAPLLAIPEVTFVSLQKGPAAAEIAGLDAALHPFDWMDQVADFADTAALVANLDLVISVDTSVVHLAGALGKTVWILSRFDGCWRWLQNGQDSPQESPWYPTARLYRQRTAGNWTKVVEHAAVDLRQLASSYRGTP